MKAQGVKPDILTYNCLIHVCGREELARHATAIFKDILAAGLQPERETDVHFHCSCFQVCFRSHGSQNTETRGQAIKKAAPIVACTSETDAGNALGAFRRLPVVLLLFPAQHPPAQYASLQTHLLTLLDVPVHMSFVISVSVPNL